MALAINPAEVLETYYGAIDDGRLDDAFEHFAEDARQRFGNGPVLEGRQAILAGATEFLGQFKRLRHDITNVLAGDYPTVGFEVTVTYTLPSDAATSLPGAAVCEFGPDGRFTDMRIYVDLAPVVAGLTATAEI